MGDSHLIANTFEQGNAVLTDLNLRNIDLRPAGAKVVDDMLKANKALKKCDLGYNNLGTAGKQLVKDAVKDGHDGLTLQL